MDECPRLEAADAGWWRQPWAVPLGVPALGFLSTRIRRIGDCALPCPALRCSALPAPALPCPSALACPALRALPCLCPWRPHLSARSWRSWASIGRVAPFGRCSRSWADFCDRKQEAIGPSA